MNKKKIACMAMAALISSSTITVSGVFEISEVMAYETSNSDSKAESNSNQGVSTAVISKFNLYNNSKISDYNKVFKMDNSNIASITNNGGKYANSTIDKAIDGNLNTHWETGKPNDSRFTNEVIITLKEATDLNRIIYAARQDGAKGKGFAQDVEIYKSDIETGDDFQLVATGSYKKSTGDLVEIKFNSTKFKRIKFRFKTANQGWASASEFMFYKEDSVTDKIEKLFTDGLMMKLKDEFNSVDAINKLEEGLKNHPLEEQYKETLNLAKNIVSNKDYFKDTKVLTAEQRGKYGDGTSKRSINGAAYASFQSFGRYVTQGEKITVYVDADANGVLPKLCFGQVGKDKNDWRRWATLHAGKNIITAPKGINPSAVYLVNEAAPKDQAYAPKVRLEGGTKFPTYFHGETDPGKFLEELKAYVEKIDYDDSAFDNGNPENKVYNIAELVSDNVILTTSAKGALSGVTQAENKGYSVADTMNGWEQMYDMFQKFLGFEKNSPDEKNSYFPNKFIGRVFQGVPLGFADHGYTGYLGSGDKQRSGGFFSLIAMPPAMRGNDNWAYTHEFGHIFNTKYIVDGEVTNNLFAQEFRRINNLGGDRSNWNGILNRFKGEKVNLGYFERLAILSQLNIAYGYDAYGKASKVVRNNTNLIKSIEGSEIRRLAVAYSLGVGENLLEFFKGWGYTDITPQMEAAVKNLPKPSRKIEYLHGGAYDYKGSGFSKDVKVSVTSNINEADKTNKLSFKIDDKNKSDLLGYEILKDGQVIGYTRDSSFTIKNVNPDENAKYEVKAYAKDLTTSQAVDVYSYEPTLSSIEKVTLKLSEEFDPMKYVVARNYKNEKLSNISVNDTVDVKKTGTYTVTYSITDNGITKTSETIVDVVSDYKYLSDSQWTSVETGYGTPRRNTNIKGRVNGEVKIFEKGFGIHANGKITYDLTNKNYDKFEALLGVDMSISAQNSSSIKFNIIGDGNTLATTKVLKHADDMVYVNVPVKGVKTLVIEVSDAGNGNASDHSIIADPKLTTNNANPEINASNRAVKVGTEFDLMENVTAMDAEDGDMTSKIQVSGTVNFNRAGKYPITYTVTDSDNNKVSKTTIISVVDMNDYKYLTDYNWKSANSGWGKIQKDNAVSGNPLRLTGENNKEVVYKKGIGTHATSTVIYDLSDKEYSYFTSYVGVDRAMYGSVGSVSFQVYVDGEKKFDSGLMKSRDPQKYVEVDIDSAKELKLVVTDGGNGIGSDHATWGDTKLHFANSESVNYDELSSLIESASKYDEIMYSEESFKSFEEVLNKAKTILKDKISSQEDVNSVVNQLNIAIGNLKENANLNEIVSIKDPKLKAAIKKELNLSNDNVTIGDMYKLTKLNLSITESLEGLQYAKNLEALNIEYNSISDLSPLKDLKKLKDLKAIYQNIVEGTVNKINNRVTISKDIFNRKNEKLNPTKVVVRNNITSEETTLNLDDCIDENGVISFDTSNYGKAIHSVFLVYEDKEDNYSAQVLYMFNNKI